MKISPRFLFMAALAAGAQAVFAGDITGTVTLNGTPPAELVNDKIAADPNCGKLHTEPVKTQFYVVGANHGLKDVVVKLKGITGKSTGATAPPVLLDQKGCEYTPYIFAVQTGQKIVVRNSDPLMHNVHDTPAVAANEEQNKAQLPGAADFTFTFPAAEDFLKFKCDVHEWMLSYATVVDSPYFAVTDKDGKFTIANVPPGKYTVEARHRKASGGKPVEKEVEVKDRGVTADFALDAPK